jgi:PKD repeat protein/Zn-dependent metalloprotease
MKKKKWFRSKIFLAVTLAFVLCCFMATSSWAARKIDITAANAKGFIGKLNQNGAELGSALGLDSDDGFQLLRQITDANGETHYRYQQTYKGIPVLGMQTIVSKGSDKKVRKLTGNFVLGSPGDVGGIPTSLDPEGALRQMQELHKAKDPSAVWNFRNETYGTYVYFHKKSQKARLCYVVSFFADTESGNPSQPIFFINAKNGKVLDSYDMLRYQGVGPGGNLKIGYYYYGTDYPPFCVSENGSTCTMNCTDVKTVDLNHGTSGTTAYSYPCYENTHEQINGAYCPLNDAQYFGQVVFDTYLDWYGVPVLPFQLTLRCHYSTNYENAFWDGSTMTFGDGYTTFYPLVSLDVVGHEVSHGFTEYNSGLIYSSQSGGINEAFSDIAGEACEYYMRGTNDFMCGYDIFKAAGQALRYLYDPPLDGISIDHVDDYYEGMDVHYSSGIFNKAFYLIATSPGWDTHMAFDIFVKANQVYWVPSSTFVQGAEGVMNAAVDLNYNCQHVVDAFAQVGIYLTCPGPPIADFSASLTTGGVPLTTHFTDLSQAAASWLWDFGDGGTSTEQNPTHTYNLMGVYTVTLTATNQFGSDDEVKVNYITVTAPQPPIANFTADNTDINLNNVVQFTDLSLENPTSWSWTFEGGTPATSTEQNPAVTYTTVGTFDVTLVVSNAQGTDTMTKVDYISVSEKPYCASQGNTFSMEWIAGVQIGTMNNTSGAAGYTDFTNITCDLTGGDTVNVVLTPGFNGGPWTEYWKIWIDYNDDHDFEDPGEEVFSGASTSVVSGNFTVASGIDRVTRMRVSMKYAAYPTPCETFTYGEVEDYTANVTSGGCPLPVANFTASATTIFEGESVTFTDQTTNSPYAWDWTFAGGTPGSSTLQNPTVTYYTAGTYTVTLTATNACGSDTETKVGYITVEPPCQPTVADFSASATTIYEGDSVNFTDLSTNNPYAWDWTFAGGTPGTSTQQNPTITYYTAGTYTVTLTATNACGSDTETKVGYITVLPIPQTEMYVYDITQTISKKGKNYESTAVVTIWDTNNNPVANATVYITWSGVVSGSGSGITLANGTVTLKSPKTKTPTGSFTITVNNVTHATLPYNPALNNETSDTTSY